MSASDTPQELESAPGAIAPPGESSVLKSRWDRVETESLSDIPQENWFYAFMRSIIIVLSKLFFRLEIHGAEKLPSQGGVLLVPNHASNLDPTTIACLLPRQVHFLAKEELFVGLLGKFLLKVNAHPLKRSGIDRAAIRLCRDLLRQGHVLMLFPEGQRTKTGELLEPKPGAALIAAQARVPLVPAYIQGSLEAMPTGAKWIKPKKIRVFIGDPFMLEDIDVVTMPKKDYYEMAGQVIMQKIKELETQARTMR
jgi:1-acyl-sn-glycerol-3-phosphate acyltransferase